MCNPKKQSFSRMNTFVNKCERCHAFDALLPQKYNPVFAKGTQVHDALEAIGNFMIKGMDVTDAVEQVLAIPADGPLDQSQINAYVIRAANAMRHTQPVAVEKWFDEHSDYPRLVGKIDLISDRIPITDRNGNIVGSEEGRVILDHKTTNSAAYIKSPAEARLALQLQIYSLIEECDAVGYLWYLPGGPVKATIIKPTDLERRVARVFVRDTIEIIEGRWQEAHDRAENSDRDTPDHLLIKGYDLSAFSLGSSERPFINSSTSRHRELCLGIKKGE